MLALLRLFLDLCLLRQAPQDIPYSSTLLKVLFFVYAVVAFLALMPIDDPLKSLLEVGVEMSLISVFVWGLLAYAGKSARFTQVLCAFLGTDALISSFALPLIVAISLGQLSELAMVVLFGLMVWHWVVCGHIIRHALSLRLDVALGIAFLYSWGFYQLMNGLFPMPGA